MSEDAKTKAGKTALYQVVVADIRLRIERGEYALGERLPSIRVLCERYDVSNITISAALRDLVAAGLVESRPRSGVFVRDKGARAATANLNGDCVLAFVVPGSRAPFWMEIIHGAEAACHKRGYRLLVATSQNEAQNEARQLESLAREVAGILVTPVVHQPDFTTYCALIRRGVPLVFVDHFLSELALPSVTTDNVEGGFLATNHLLQSGRRRVLVIAEGTGSSIDERLLGYRRALQQSAIAYNPELFYRAPQGDSAGYNGMRALLEKCAPREPFGVFAMNEYIARGAYIALREAGLSIPDDAAVVGFDDAFAPFFEPPLSTVRQNLRGMGEAAVKLLLEAIDNKSTTVGARGSATRRAPRRVHLKPELVVRNSSDHSSNWCLKEHFNGTGERALENVAR